MSKAKELQPWKSKIFHIDMEMSGGMLSSVIYTLDKLWVEVQPHRTADAPIADKLEAQIKELGSIIAHLKKILEGEG
jgi:hypothetical protein